jgi:hypothetical protein
MPSQPDNRRIIDVRTLPSSRETLAYRDGGLWPVTILTPDGTVLAAVRAGAGHLGPGGRLDIVRSWDAGRSWAPPEVIANHPAWSEANPGFGVAQDGTLALAWMRSGMFDADGTYAPERSTDDGYRLAEVWYSWSTDNGFTWAPAQPMPIKPYFHGAPFGKMVLLPDGVLLMPLYCQPNPQSGAKGSASYVLRSRDNGRTWNEPSLIHDGTGEPAVTLLPNGELIAALRENDADQALSISHSADGGFTWSERTKVTGKRQHPGDIAILRDGSVLLTYGNRTPPYRVEGRISRDNGRTWLDPLLTFSGHLYGYDLPEPRPNDFGYPSTVIRRSGGTGEGVCVYYSHPAIDTSQTRPRAGNERYYLVDNYRATALTWDEDELLAAIETP